MYSLLLFLGLALLSHSAIAQELKVRESVSKLENELVGRYGEVQGARAKQGLQQIARLWRAEDGGAAELEDFVRKNFAGEKATLDSLFHRCERLLERLDGHMGEISREFRQQTELDLGPVLPFDEVLAGYDPSAHISEDFFRNKIAFAILLNFPLTTLEQRLREGEQWTRRQWAETRLAQRFSRRIPADVNLAIAQATAEADQYIADYNIWMHHLIDQSGARLFPPKLRLLSHWNLRDQIKADYDEPKTGLARQRMIQRVMERIVTQTIPAAAINNPRVDWNPLTNDVQPSAVDDAPGWKSGEKQVSAAPEPDTRYAVLLKTFLASRKADPYVPTAPSLIARRFDENREIPEERVKAMFEQVLRSPLVSRVARLIESRLGRPLEPFDIWYNGFRRRAAYTETMLDEIVAKKYPTAEAFQRDIPSILVKLGFTRERAEFLAGKIVVDPARGSGHALGAAMRSASTHLRTRVEKGGMNYKGFNIAVHELGHNVEQIFSLNEIDHTLLQGVPNTAFTEAFAFVFQGRDMEILGLSVQDAKTEAWKTLNDFWGTYEIAGVALVDMAVWHWMYDHPNAKAAQLKDATLHIARSVWNEYYAPVFRKKDIVLLGIYSHMIHSFLYLPDYPLGHLIAHQIEEQMKKAGGIGAEFERMATVGDVAPDLWMKKATGMPVGAGAMLEAAQKAYTTVTGTAPD